MKRSLAVVAALMVGSTVQASPVEVVVSHFDENLAWLSKLAAGSESPQISIYTKGPAEGAKEWNPNMEVHRLPNVGRESHTYLNHIVKNYNKLADWTVFTQAGEPSFGYRGHRAGGGHLLAGDTFANYLTPDPSGARFIHTAVVQLPSMNHLLRAAFCINSTDVEAGSVTACPRVAAKWSKWWDIGAFHDFIASKIESQGGEPVMDFYRHYINPSHVDREVTISFSQGARFAVARAKIQSRPKADYERLLETLSHDADPYSGYFMEWMWSELFQGHQELCPMPPKTATISHPMAMDELAQRFPEAVKKHFVDLRLAQAEASRSLQASVSGGISGGISGGVPATTTTMAASMATTTMAAASATTTTMAASMATTTMAAASATTTTMAASMATTTMAAASATTTTMAASMATTTMAAASVTVTKVVGTMTLDVPSCKTFTETPGVKGAVAAGIASASGMTATSVVVALSCPSTTRRLASGLPARRLGEAVNAGYEITVPEGSFTITAASVTSSIVSAGTLGLTAKIATAMAAANITGIVVSVTSVPAPETKTMVVSLTTKAPTTTAKPKSTKSSARQVFTAPLAAIMAMAMAAFA